MCLIRPSLQLSGRKTDDVRRLAGFNILGAIFVVTILMRNILVIKQNKWLKRQSANFVNENNQLRDNYNQNAKEFNALLARNKLLRKTIEGTGDKDDDTR